VAAKLSSTISAVLVKVIGVTSCLYTVWDIASDVLFRSIPCSDANALGRITFIPGVVWGVLWILISIAVIIFSMWMMVKSSLPGEAVKV
jgi:hypothetical protein